MKKIDTAVILAAGRGKRLKELSADRPKPLVKVHGKSILANLIEALIEAGTKRVVIVVGYKAELIIEDLRVYTDSINIKYVTNEIFDTTNNIYSLWLAKNYLDNGFFLYEADVFCDFDIVKSLSEAQKENVMVIDKFNERMNGTVVTFDANKRITNMYLKRHQTDGFLYENTFKTVNFYKISPEFYQDYFKDKLDYYIKNNDVSYYYEAIIKDAIDAGFHFYGLLTDKRRWWEIDTVDDLRITEDLFSD